ncbi:hypothetical protein EDD85DRAFT_265664 [Armillaria nabsnona]|nr:hypothetical protein EDD85DRAFT_265664 [Armillaria nabsnona]
MFNGTLWAVSARRQNCGIDVGVDWGIWCVFSSLFLLYLRLFLLGPNSAHGKRVDKRLDYTLPDAYNRRFRPTQSRMTRHRLPTQPWRRHAILALLAA